MSMHQILLIIFGSFFGSLFIIWIISRIVLEYFKEKVKQTSPAYHKIMKLNEQYQSIFHQDLKTENYCHRVCNSKREFDNVSLDLEFEIFIEERLSFFDTLLQKLAENKANYEKYLHAYEKKYVLSTREQIKQYSIPYKTYQALEAKLCAKAKIEPILITSGMVEVSYTSPAGRNSYNKERHYSFAEIKTLVPEIHKSLEYRATQEYLRKVERAKVTMSVRYDVIKRDASTCRICNSSPKDGVKLHVDHIVPVSKGGKTELSNLQTLCERCNLGKKDKI